jgi:IS1 family transposase
MLWGDAAPTLAKSSSKAYRAAYIQAQTVSDWWEAYKPVFGQDHRCVGKESGETAHVERWNNTLRQRLSRFVRKTLSFSKTEENHEASLKLFIMSTTSLYAMNILPVDNQD